MGQALPDIDVRHVLRMSDDTGMLQHAAFAAPDPRHGYCTDDNARALIAGVYHERLTPSGGDSARRVRTPEWPDRRAMARATWRYLSFLEYALNDETGRFRNFCGYDRRWLEPAGSEDSHGRAMWGLGTAARYAADPALGRAAAELFLRALPAAERLRFLRSQAFALLGMNAYLRAEPGDQRVANAQAAAGERFYAAYLECGSHEWPWWEDTLTYANARLPQALLVTGAALRRPDWVESALASLRWLLTVQPAGKGPLSLIGNAGWFTRGGRRASFDQQPIEAHGLVGACLDALEVSGDDGWRAHAGRSFEWFTGRNDVGLPLADPQTGGCRDGLEPGGVNANEGAESTLAYVLSVMELHLHARRGRGTA